MIEVRQTLLLLFGALPACGGRPPCVEDGKTKVLIPEARLGAVAEVQVSGVCSVEQPTATCDGNGPRCTPLPDGQLVMVLTVSSTKRGACTVTVAFNDGCPFEVRRFDFGGPLHGCCEDVCARSQQLVPLPSECASTE